MATSAFRDWVDRARAEQLGSVLLARSIPLTGKGRNRSGPCPNCGGEDRFAVDLDKQLFNCRGCGGKGHGAISLVRFLDNVSFLQAVETITGQPAPKDGPRSKGANGRKPRGTLECSYSYRDELDDEQYQVVRYCDPKSFSQRRPDPDHKGAWIENLSGVRLVPYRLTDLIEGIANGHPIYVVEGEKDADNGAEKLGIVTTTTAMGLAGKGHWQSGVYDEFFRDADIILVPDQDEDEHKGPELARVIAKRLKPIAKSVKILNLPVKDLSDWIEGGGTREALDAMELVEPVVTNGYDGQRDALDPAMRKFDGDPVDLWGHFEPPMLPRGLLPESIEDYAFIQAATMGVDPGGVAMAALAVCAGATPDSIQLVMKQHTEEWTESARLWVALVGMPSTKKSPIISATIKPLAKLDAKLFKEFQSENELYEQLDKEERKSTTKPVQTRLRLEDATIEAAQEVLAGSPNGLLMVLDELSGFFGGMDKYSGHRGAAKDRGFWLQSFNGGPYAFNRVGRGAGIIPNLSVSLLGGIQPDLISRLSAESYDDGFLQRMQVIVLRPADVGKDVPTPSVSKDYARLVERLTELRLPVSGLDDEGVLRFDGNAQAMRSRLEAEHLVIQGGVEVISRKLAAHIGKYDGLFGRLCVVWHCIEHAFGPHRALEVDDPFGSYLPATVTEETATRVAKFMRGFLLPHAFAFYGGVLKLADDHDRLTAVAGFILAHQKQRMTNRDVQRGDRSMRKLARRDIEAVFEQLDALGWVARTPGPRPSDPPHWIVNPVVHQKFAARAKAEAERRERERAIVSEMLQRDTAA